MQEKNVKPRKQKVADIRRLKKSGKTSISKMLFYSFLLSIFFIFVSNTLSYYQKGNLVSLSQVVKDIADENYTHLYIKDSYVIVEKPVKKKVGFVDVYLQEREYAKFGNSDFYQLLYNEGVNISDLQNDYFESGLGMTFGDILLLISLAGSMVVGFILIKNMQASGSKLVDFGKSQAKLLWGKKVDVTFDDVAGIDQVKDELIEVVDFLKHPKKYEKLGARIPKGVLLVGAPGTGKTMLAKAVAGEAGVPFFHTSGSEFEEMLVGAGASRVRDLFKKARRAAPCIIFIDEIDAVAKKRGVVLHGGHSEQTLNQILVEMDGLDQRNNVIVIAATNRPDVLDPALLRPGRFDRTVVVPMPDYKARKKILDVHKKNKKLAEDVDLDLIAKKTIGYSGADLENLLNEAAIMAATQGKKEITQELLTEAYLKVKLGRKQTQDKDGEDLRRTALHEAGHAVVAFFTKDSAPVEKISILSRGLSGGVTLMVPEDDKKYQTKSMLMADLRVAVGGFVAENIFYKGNVSTGPTSDLKEVTKIAKRIVKEWGMSDKLGFVSYESKESMTYLGYDYGGAGDYSDKTAELIDSEVKRLIDEAISDATKIIIDNKTRVENLAELLMKNEEVEKEEFVALMNGKNID